MKRKWVFTKDNIDYIKKNLFKSSSLKSVHVCSNHDPRKRVGPQWGVYFFFYIRIYKTSKNLPDKHSVQTSET